MCRQPRQPEPNRRRRRRCSFDGTPPPTTTSLPKSYPRFIATANSFPGVYSRVIPPAAGARLSLPHLAFPYHVDLPPRRHLFRKTKQQPKQKRTYLRSIIILAKSRCLQKLVLARRRRRRRPAISRCHRRRRRHRRHLDWDHYYLLVNNTAAATQFSAFICV